MRLSTRQVRLGREGGIDERYDILRSNTSHDLRTTIAGDSGDRRVGVSTVARGQVLLLDWAR